MKKTIKTFLKAMLPVFMLVMFLPTISRTIQADEQSETITINNDTVYSEHFKVQGDYKGEPDNAMFIGNEKFMIISAIQGKEKLITKVELGYSTTGTFDIDTLTTSPASTTEDHTTFTINSPTYSVDFSSAAQANLVRVTSVKVYYDDSPVSATGISLAPNADQTVKIGEKFSFTAAIEPLHATDKKVKWNVSNGNVALYTDQTYNTPVGTDATSVLTVYAKGEAAGNATVTVTSNEKAELSASCNVVVTSESDFITVEPQDAIVSYPAGATFTVEVADESKVASYQWRDIDIATGDHILEGLTANTKTLTVPSTVQRDQILYFYCVVTDTEGKTYTTRHAKLDQSNRTSVNKPVLYVGEYAVEPGQTLDLATKYHDYDQKYPLGSGTVSVTMDEDSLDIYFNNVQFDNRYTTASFLFGGNVGIDLEWQAPPTSIQEVNLILIGENKIIDRLYQPAVNLSGIPLYFCYWGRGLQNAYSPMTNIKSQDSSSSLTVVNGTTAISAIGNLTIDGNINVDQNRIMYSEGIVAFNIEIKQDSVLNLHTNGKAIDATHDQHNTAIKGDLTIDDARIIAYTREPHVGQGASGQNGIFASNDLMINKSLIDYEVEIDYSEEPGQTITEIAGVEFFKGNTVKITDSIINLELADHYADDKDHAGFAHHMIGLYGNVVEINSSDVYMDLNSKMTLMVSGIKGSTIQITNGSKVNVDVETGDGALAVYSSGNLKIENSDVNAIAKNLTGNRITPFAIAAARINIDLDENNKVVAVAENNGDRVAIAGMHGPYFVFDDQNGPSSDAGEITLADDTIVVIPQNNRIGLADTKIKAEEPIEVKTVIDTTNNEKIADEVVIATKPIEDLYELIEGKNAEWGADRSSVLQIRIERSTLDWMIEKHFKEVLVDGNTLSTEFYFLKTGSLIVQIKPVFLRTLSVGEHTISVVFDDGRVDTVFKIIPQRYIPPVTGIE